MPFLLKPRFSKLLVLACLLSVSAWVSAWVPAWAAEIPPNEVALREKIIQFPKVAEHYEQLAQLLLERLRADWLRQDPSMRGAATLSVAEDFNRRARELIYLLEKVKELKPNQVELLIQMAEIQYLFLGSPQESTKLLKQALEQAPQNPRVIIAYADFTFFDTGKRAEALDQLRKAIQTYPNENDFVITLADLLSTAVVDVKDYAEAKAVLSQALEKKPEAQNLRLMLARVWLREANRNELKIDKAGLGEALKLFQAVTIADPSNDAALSELAQTAQQLGEIELAESALRQLLSLQPQNALAKLLLGDVKLLQSGKELDQGLYPASAAEADQLYAQLVAAGQDSQLAVTQRVQMYYNQGLLAMVEAAILAAKTETAAQAEKRYRESIAHYEKAQMIFDNLNVLNPVLQKDLGRSYHGMGLLYQKSERMAEAVGFIQTACSLKHDESCAWLKKNNYGR
ncbi:MAG: tetratricopeptide repeat protein [Candidatus Sericytochromatia bacterium]|nr:tetratricopeptide repeat protein [Candidatus Sericytochromatia bacterium]